MAASMRPLTLGEILDRTVQLYRRNFLLFAGISFLPSALYVLVSGSASIWFSSQIPALQHPGAPAAPPDLQAMLAIGVFGLAFVLIGIPILLGGAALALGALTQAAFQTNRGEPAAIGAAYSYGFRHFWRHVGIFFLQIVFAGVLPGMVFGIILVGAGIVMALAAGGAAKSLALLTGLVTILLFVAFFVVCVWIWLRYCLAFPASVTEQSKAWPSLQRSASLGKGTRGRIFVMYLMVVILTVVTYYALTIPVDLVLKFTLYKSMDGVALLTRPPVLLQVVNLFISCLERTFAMPIYAIALLLFYNDQRTRKEGYDIEMLMNQAGWSQLPPTQLAGQPVPSASPVPAGYQPPPTATPPPPENIPFTPEPPPAVSAQVADPVVPDSPHADPASEGAGA